MTQIYRPTQPQLNVETFLKRYDKNQSKREESSRARSGARAGARSGARSGAGREADAVRSNGSARRSRRQNDPARAERRRQQLKSSYQEVMAQVEELAVPKALLSQASAKGLAELSPWLQDHATGAYVGLCTLGEALDIHMRELTETDIASAAILNEVALAWIVAITQEMREWVAAEVQPNNLKAGAAYRPGLGRWPLQVQTIVFAELPTDEIGVTLTDSLLMLPGFSTSLVLPLLPLPTK